MENQKNKVGVFFCYCPHCGKRKNTMPGSLCDNCTYGRMISFEELCADPPGIKSLTTLIPPTPGMFIEIWKNIPPAKEPYL